jgi:hypothetical protein
VAIVCLTLAACAATPPLPASTPSATPGSRDASQSPGASASHTLPGPDDVWSSLAWRLLEADEPLGTYIVVRARYGFVGYTIPIPTETGARTQLAVSPDGSIWSDLPQTAIGSDSVVIGLYAMGDTLLALTLKGSADQGALEPPLRAWTSTNGVDWALQAEPMNLPVVPGAELGEVLTAASGSVALVAHSIGGGQVELARTADGQTWTAFTATGLPAGFELRSLGALSDGFVMTGNAGLAETTSAIAAWSPDGEAWDPASFPAPALAPDILGIAAHGMVIETAVDSTPSGPTWWKTTDGQTWLMVDDFAPLGIWNGQREGTGLLPDGDLTGDGERMVAYDTNSGGRGWTSFDGANWTQLTTSGDAPAASSNSRIRVEPVGLIWSDGEKLWLGEPR